MMLLPCKPLPTIGLQGGNKGENTSKNTKKGLKSDKMC